MVMDQARTFSAEQRKKLAAKGQAMSDGSFPIVTKGDLRNAIQAYGRASNKAAAKRHIIKRAKALGATNLLPEDWKSDSADVAAETKLYYFEGRNTPIAATSVTEARKKKKRGGDKLVKVRVPTAAEKKKMSNGEWVRTRKDGKGPGSSKYGKGRGYGPPRKKDAASAAPTSGAAMSPLFECAHETCSRRFVDEASLVEHAEAVHTLSERRNLVSMAVRTAHGKDSFLIDLSEDWLVFDRYDEGAGAYKVFKQNYSMDAKGNIKLGGGMAEVVRKVSYVPVPKIEIAQKMGIGFATDVASERPKPLAAQDDRASLGSQTTLETSEVKTPKPHKFAPQPNDPSKCSVCNRPKADKLHGGDEAKEGSKSDYPKKKGTEADIFICPSCKAEFQHDADVKSHRKQKSH